MISVTEAKQKILDNAKEKQAVTIAVDKALNYSLAEDIYAPNDVPNFKQSAMDGYAIRIDEEIRNYQVVSEVKAGDTSSTEALMKGQAVRIFTGAPVPEGANAVVMQELAAKEGNIVKFEGEIVEGSNIRAIGAQIAKGDVALEKGSWLNPAALGFLTTLGIIQVSVFPGPKVAMIVTGNELAKVGEPLQPGQIYESNSIAISSLLQNDHMSLSAIEVVGDDPQRTLEVTSELLDQNDVIILSGGISVGKYDYVAEVLANLGVETVFHKIKQKPGKPMYFGKKGDKMVFALPGNPGAALVCCYEYVLPALRKMTGRNKYFIKSLQAELTEGVKIKGDRDTFFKARYRNGEVTILDGQGSNYVKSFAEANALAYLTADKNDYAKGDKVEVHLLPGYYSRKVHGL